ncbi:MAG: type II CRISPR-associated endonuclease Cas1 [Hyphomicrobiaceae bacterium]|nr:type II CRISPR-associated endonuclease Cas1 [Hyphomicrobiaceae bacterium]
MVGRIIEVASDGVHLSTERGFMRVCNKSEEIGRIPLDDISALIVHAHGSTYSTNLVDRLARRGTPIIVCASNHTPVAIIWPLDGHFEQGFRMQAQARASKPLNKRLWQALIRAKIQNQAYVIAQDSKPDARLKRLAKQVRSGDPDNIEAQAAQRYWPLLMGKQFRRDRNMEGANSLLNYGYTILRSAVARSIIAAGLHPSLSIHHQSRGTALRLADDIMEPYRPLVDWQVKQLLKAGKASLDMETKRQLASLPTMDLLSPLGKSPLQICLDKLATSVARVYLKERKELEIAVPDLPTYQQVCQQT